MLPLTPHAQHRASLCIWALGAVEGLDSARSTVRRLVAAVPPTREDIAVYVEVPPGVQDSARRQWSKVTHMVAIARDGQIQTVMFTRVNQLNTGHLNVARIEEVK